MTRLHSAHLIMLFAFIFSLVSMGGMLAQPLEQAACPGFIASRLVVGEQGRVLPGDANNVRAAADSGSELVAQIPGGGTFLVLEGPVCAGGFAWWRVEYGGIVGWTVEGSGSEYWLEPAGPLPTQAATVTPQATVVPTEPGAVACPGFMPSRLVVGEQGRVVFGPANNLRAEPVSNSQLLAEIPGGATFTVLEGPLCAGGLAWWRVNYRGVEGWTAEGLDDEYWLEPAGPLPTQAPTLTLSITPTPRPTLTPSPTSTPTSVPVPVTTFTGRDTLLFAPLPDGRQPITTANITGLQPLSLIGRGGVERIAWSPDGQTIAVLNGLGIWLNDADAPENQVGRLLESIDLRFHVLAFSPDSALLAAGSLGYEGNTAATLQLWNVQTGERLPLFRQHLTPVASLAYSPDGTLAVGYQNGEVRLVETASGEIGRVVEEHVGSVIDLAFSPDGTQLASVGNDNLVRVWNVAQQEHQINYESLGGMYDVAYSPDGAWLLATGGGGDSRNPGVLRIWDVVTKARVDSPAFAQTLSDMAFSPDGATLAIQGQNGSTVYLWDVASRRLVQPWN